MRTNIFPRHLKIWAECRAEVVTGRYCGACAAEAARRTMADIASLSRMKPKSKKEKERISRVLSSHAVANTWWDPSSLTNWMTEECLCSQDSTSPQSQGRVFPHLAVCLDFRNGKLYPNERPGLGVELDFQTAQANCRIHGTSYQPGPNILPTRWLHHQLVDGLSTL
jgi:hypothetical protein